PRGRLFGSFQSRGHASLCPPYSTFRKRATRAKPSVPLGAAANVRFDHAPGPGPAAQAYAIDLDVLEDALDVVAGFRERNALDPIDRIDLGIARIAVAFDPFLD